MVSAPHNQRRITDSTNSVSLGKHHPSDLSEKLFLYWCRIYNPQLIKASAKWQVSNISYCKMWVGAGWCRTAWGSGLVFHNDSIHCPVLWHHTHTHTQREIKRGRFTYSVSFDYWHINILNVLQKKLDHIIYLKSIWYLTQSTDSKCFFSLLNLIISYQ